MDTAAFRYCASGIQRPITVHRKTYRSVQPWLGFTPSSRHTDINTVKLMTLHWPWSSKVTRRGTKQLCPLSVPYGPRLSPGKHVLPVRYLFCQGWAKKEVFDGILLQRQSSCPQCVLRLAVFWKARKCDADKRWHLISVWPECPTFYGFTVDSLLLTEAGMPCFLLGRNEEPSNTQTTVLVLSELSGCQCGNVIRSHMTRPRKSIHRAVEIGQ